MDIWSIEYFANLVSFYQSILLVCVLIGVVDVSNTLILTVE